MIRVSHILGVELPVGVNELARIPQNPQRARKDPVQPRTHGWAKILRQRFNPLGKGGKDQTVVRSDCELLERMLGRLEIGWVSPFALNPFSERHPDEIAV